MSRCVSVSEGIGSEMGGSGAVSAVAVAEKGISVRVDGSVAPDTPTAAPSFLVSSTPLFAAADDSGGGKGVDSLAMLSFLPYYCARLGGKVRGDAKRLTRSEAKTQKEEDKSRGSDRCNGIQGGGGETRQDVLENETVMEMWR